MVNSSLPFPTGDLVFLISLCVTRCLARAGAWGDRKVVGCWGLGGMALVLAYFLPTSTEASCANMALPLLLPLRFFAFAWLKVRYHTHNHSHRGTHKQYLLMDCRPANPLAQPPATPCIHTASEQLSGNIYILIGKLLRLILRLHLCVRGCSLTFSSCRCFFFFSFSVSIRFVHVCLWPACLCVCVRAIRFCPIIICLDLSHDVLLRHTSNTNKESNEIPGE